MVRLIVSYDSLTRAAVPGSEMCIRDSTQTAYAVWVGIGASLTVVYGMLSGTEPVSVAKVLLIAGLIACVVGLKLVHDAG